MCYEMGKKQKQEKDKEIPHSRLPNQIQRPIPLPPIQIQRPSP